DPRLRPLRRAHERDRAVHRAPARLNLGAVSPHLNAQEVSVDEFDPEGKHGGVHRARDRRELRRRRDERPAGADRLLGAVVRSRPWRPRTYTAFERTWAKRCPGVVTSLREGGDELLTFFTFPKGQWKTLRTTNTIERLHEEFRRRVKTQGSLPSEDAALTLLFGLVVSGQIKLRRID